MLNVAILVVLVLISISMNSVSSMPGIKALTNSAADILRDFLLT